MTKLTRIDIDDIFNLNVSASQILWLWGETGLDIVRRSHGARSRIPSAATEASGGQASPPTDKSSAVHRDQVSLLRVSHDPLASTVPVCFGRCVRWIARRGAL